MNADRLADRVGQTTAVTRDHPLREQRYPQKLERHSRPEKHSHGKPCSGVTVGGGEDDEQSDLYPDILEERSEEIRNFVEDFHQLDVSYRSDS